MPGFFVLNNIKARNWPVGFFLVEFQPYIAPDLRTIVVGIDNCCGG